MKVICANWTIYKGAQTTPTRQTVIVGGTYHT